ncbi:UNVERIFIED_CONTAM: hypothetical protein RMT77_003577 [Armadillidium vulgare]
MSSKKKPQEDKDKRRKIYVEVKREIIEKRERGVSVTDLARTYNRSTSTICTILKDKDKIMKIDASKGVTRISTKRPRILDDVERLLLVWINEKQIQGLSLNENIIREKAKAIFVNLVKKTPGASTDEETFKASRGWFEKFKRRTGIHSVVRHCAANSETKAATDRRSIGKRKRNTSEEGLKLKDTENSPERFQTDDNLHEKSLETAATCGFSIFSDNSNTVPSQTPETNEDADPLQFNESNNGEFPLSIIDHKNVSRSSQIMENENKEIEIRDNEKIKLCKNRNNESTITDHLQSQERLSNHVFIQNLDDPLRPPSHFVDNPSCSQSYETEFDLFGKSVAKQLNNMQLNDALQAQLKIQEFLTNFRLRRLSRRPTPNNSSIETPSQCDDNIDVKMEIVDFI